MSRSLFVSDIHISSATDPKAVLFGRFLNKVIETKPDHLFLLGDIFDLWLSDQTTFIEAYQGLIDSLIKLHAGGTKIYYFEGNHDLDLQPFWRRKLGFEVFEHAAYFHLGGLRVRAEHGDQMDPDDRGYLFLRWFLRTLPLRLTGRYLPAGVLRWIGSKASAASRDYTSTTKAVSDDNVKAKITRHALKAFNEKPFDLIVSGHVHVLMDEELKTSNASQIRCINLGTWLTKPFVLSLTPSETKLMALDEFLKQ